LLDFRGGVNSTLLFHLLTDKLESNSKNNHLINWRNPLADRAYNMLALFNTNYKRNTVAWQRKNVIHQLRKINDHQIVFDKKVPLAEEISIRRHSKIILSLFGWGEICSRDFQAFIAGAALIAPDTSHLVTWPVTHIPRQTYWPIKWDLSDLDKAYSTLINNNALRLSIAMTAQQKYKGVWSINGRQRFCLRLLRQITRAQPSAPSVKTKNPNLKVQNTRN
jgi:hypothetical protein